MPLLSDYNDYILEINGLYWMNLNICKKNREMNASFPGGILNGATVSIQTVTRKYLNDPKKGKLIPYGFNIVTFPVGVHLPTTGWTPINSIYFWTWA
jgi:hypothetical protein